MFIFTIIAVFIGLIVYIICGKEKDVYANISQLSWFKMLIKFVYKLVTNRRQGVLQLHKSLVYVAGGGNADCTIEISPRNHKVIVQRITYVFIFHCKYSSLHLTLCLKGLY